MRVPPGALQSGGAYVVAVNADAMPGHQTETAPYLLGFPESFAPAISGLFQVP